MKSDPINPSPETQRQKSPGSSTGLGMADILALPDLQGKIVNCIIRNQQCTLSELAAHLTEDEQILGSELNSLVEQGFVQEIQEAGESRYGVKLARKRGGHLPEGI
ncbi:MAG: hypothetical protein F6K47_23085 [Symploca sp. SIO2E6]|nr:hypothetical protein [Symploca sp. SIO2E6]